MVRGRQPVRRAALPPALLEAVADLSRRRALPVYTHVYETRVQRIFSARPSVRTAPRLSSCRRPACRSLVPCARRLAAGGSSTSSGSGTNVVLNMLSNLKLKSGDRAHPRLPRAA
jgi:cytosine/adenosine deaminase-related metal-dependent hydrolase